MTSILYLVVPCYNEEEVLPETSRRLGELLHRMIDEETISPLSRILFVNDGSRDKTWEIIEELHGKDPLFSGLCLSRNKGHQNALLAGLMTAKEHADAVISLDADLQDDIGAIEAMVEKFHGGCDIVYGVRSSRKKDSFFKRSTAVGFYHIMKLLGVDIVFNHADYRLMSRRALEALAEFDEVNLFLRGIVPLIGFPTATVEYERNERFAGESKYPLKKMLSFAFDGITSFSIRPIRLILWVGLLIFLISIGVLIWSLVAKLVGVTVAGWTSILASIWMIGGIQLLCLGVIGEYIGKIYAETKHRPKYIIACNLLDDESKGKKES